MHGRRKAKLLFNVNGTKVKEVYTVTGFCERCDCTPRAKSDIYDCLVRVMTRVAHASATSSQFDSDVLFPGSSRGRTKLSDVAVGVE